MVRVFWDEKDVFFWTSCLGGQQWFQTLYWNTEKSNSHLCWVYPTRKMSEMLLLHDSTCVHHRGHHKFWMDTSGASTLQSSPCTNRLSPVWSSKKSPVRTPLCQWWGTTDCLESVAAQEGEQVLLGWEYVLFHKGGKKIFKKIETTFK